MINATIKMSEFAVECIIAMDSPIKKTVPKTRKTSVSILPILYKLYEKKITAQLIDIFES